MWKVIIRLILKLLIGLVLVALLTLLERNFLGRGQLRYGPNKVGPSGLLQPIADAVKLYLKGLLYPIFVNKVGFIIMPVSSLFLALVGWSILPISSNYLYYYYGLIGLLIISALRVYPIILRGWSSNAKWRAIGRLRNIAQTISYEVSIAFIIIASVIYYHSIDLTNYNSYILFIIIPLILVLWIITILAESNRAPFDLAEGERELVSGFNTEYSGAIFTVLFLAEYIFILVLSSITVLIYIGSCNRILLIGVALRILWCRITLPRLRVDSLIYLCWYLILPVSMTGLVFTSVTALKVDRIMCVI